MIPVYVIHLPNAERKARIAAELERVGFTDITYVHAKEPVANFSMSNMRRNPRGEFGCALSHLRAIATAIADDRNVALFVEDDITFKVQFPYMRDWPKAWDVVYFGGHPRGPVTLENMWARISGGFSCAEAYALDRISMPEFLQFWCNRAGQRDAMFDFILGEYAASVNGWAAYPTITEQGVGWSHIGQKVDDKRALIERGWKTNLA